MRGILCKKCSECKEHTYTRVDTKERIIKFKYCEGNKHLVALSDWYFEKDGYCYSTKRLWGTKRFLHTFYKSKRDNDLVIDHINGNRSDNRLCNLRKITNACNTQNRHDSNRSSIFPGVSKHGKKYASSCSVNGKSKYLGRYNTELEAYHAYVTYLRSVGSTVNTEVEAYKIYTNWLDEQKQSTLI